MPYAHSRNAAGDRHDLGDHLRAVADLAAEFAAPFGGEEVAHLAGLLHDIGKAHPDFQAYLAACEREPDRKRRTVDHKGAGTLAAFQVLDPLPLLIDGHHGGLPNFDEVRTKLKTLCGSDRLAAAFKAVEAAAIAIPAQRVSVPAPFANAALDYDLFLRMCFSALVDADHRDTERHFSPDRSEVRAELPTLQDLADQLEDAQSAFRPLPDDPVGRVRDEVYRACLGAATLAPGFFH